MTKDNVTNELVRIEREDAAPEAFVRMTFAYKLM